MSKNKVYAHKELASYYFPDLHPKSASRRLVSWIERDKELLDELKSTGYRKGQRIYSPRQTAILLYHLGEPETR